MRHKQVFGVFVDNEIEPRATFKSHEEAATYVEKLETKLIEEQGHDFGGDICIEQL